MQKSSGAGGNASAMLASENIQRNESEPLLDLKNTRSAKHVEICVTATDEEGVVVGSGIGGNKSAAGSGDGMAYRQRASGGSGQRKDRLPKDRHAKDRGSRSDDSKPRPPSQHSETASTEYSYSETG